MSDWRERLALELRRDWRRTGLLAGLTVVAIVLAVRQFGGGADPAQARVGSGSAPDLGQASRPVSPGREPATPESIRTGAVNRKVFVFAADAARLPAAPRRDPFVVELERFPLDPAVVGKARPVQTADLQAPAPDAEAARRRQAAQAAVQAEAAQLRLQSILMADPPRAMIGRDIYRVGQRVTVGGHSEPFVVVRITPIRVTLEKSGIEVVLTLE